MNLSAHTQGYISDPPQTEDMGAETARTVNKCQRRRFLWCWVGLRIRMPVARRLRLAELVRQAPLDPVVVPRPDDGAGPRLHHRGHRRAVRRVYRHQHPGRVGGERAHCPHDLPSVPGLRPDRIDPGARQAAFLENTKTSASFLFLILDS